MSVYPKKCNRHLTETAYVDLIMSGTETEERLIACARNYAEACAVEKTPERYIKNAENFLKEFVFEGYLPGKYVKPKDSRNPGNGFHNFEQRDTDYNSIVIDRLKERLEGRQQT